MEKQCITCKKIFTKQVWESKKYWETKKYCCIKCSGTTFNKDHKQTENWYKSQKLRIGTKRTEEFCAKMRIIAKGRKLSEKCLLKRKEAWNKHEWDEDERRKKISEGLKLAYKENRKSLNLGNIPWNKGIKMPEISGNKHPLWTGGIQKTGNGYLEVLMTEHPHANKRGYIGQHRVILEQKIGRYLTKDEVAHHINGIKNDNRPENLMVMNISEHHSMHNTKIAK